MMAAGQGLLVDEGLGVGAGDLTFKRVFERVELSTGVRLTNASVIRRVWENQAHFQDDVLMAVALAGDAGDESGATADAVLRLLASIDRSTPQGRLDGLTQACRVGGAASLRALADSRHWSLWVGVWVLSVTGTRSERIDRVRQALVDGYEATTDLWVGLHGAMIDTLGMCLREPFTLRQFTISVGALVEGCALRELTERPPPAIHRPTGPGGVLQEWTLFGVGLEALAYQYLEPDPGWADPGVGV